jgi:zinc transport system permease protein
MITSAPRRDMYMGEFVNALTDPDILFLRFALFAGLLASIAFGIVGSYVVVKRISYIAGSISHCVLGGIGAALFLQKNLGIVWFTPMFGAVLSALLAAVIIGMISLYSKEREDSVIGALWVIGMSVGIVFIAKTAGYVDPMSYLFGNILMISKLDLWITLLLDLIIIVLSILFHDRLLAVCFDEEFSRLRGVNTKFYYLFLLCLTALTIVLMVRIVGIVMVIALLTLPAAVAGHFSRRLWHMMVISTVLCMVYITGGLALSYSSNLPAGATIVLLAGMVYLLVIIVKAVRKAVRLKP